jgi:hypothetical protein
MTTTDLAAARRAVARKRPANVRRRNRRVIDGEFRPVRSHLTEAGRGIALLLMGLLFAGLVLSLTAYYNS